MGKGHPVKRESLLTGYLNPTIGLHWVDELIPYYKIFLYMSLSPTIGLMSLKP